MSYDQITGRPTGPLIPQRGDTRSDGLWARLLDRLFVSRSLSSEQDIKTDDPRKRLPLQIIPF
jgi:hypothetical protein